MCSRDVLVTLTNEENEVKYSIPFSFKYIKCVLPYDKLNLAPLQASEP